MSKLESLSEQELRQVVIDEINSTLGRLSAGPTVDGSASSGYRRQEQSLPGLACSYIQFLRVFDGKENQYGVQLALLGRFDIYLMAVRGELADFQGKDLTLEEQERQEKLIKWFIGLEDSSKRDGLAPQENRYYTIPLNPAQPVIVSAESFLVRINRANSRAANTFFFPKDIAVAEAEQILGVDSATGLPLSKRGNLQDLRDVASIVGGGKYLVRGAIRNTPPSLWGIPGITQ